ncbi:MAG: hypothetical protein OEV64_13340 [Desulfobulbaceae bacterium]|nr:hypothetical protein [Desulfobulbaceae bacterium]
MEGESVSARRMVEEITELLILDKYDTMSPVVGEEVTAESIAARKEKAMFAYLNDPVFHARIEYLAERITQIIMANTRDGK